MCPDEGMRTRIFMKVGVVRILSPRQWIQVDRKSLPISDDDGENRNFSVRFSFR